jgi:hypothetical protein
MGYQTVRAPCGNGPAQAILPYSEDEKRLEGRF